jgi:hypothetical protein
MEQNALFHWMEESVQWMLQMKVKHREELEVLLHFFEQREEAMRQLLEEVSHLQRLRNGAVPPSITVTADKSKNVVGKYENRKCGGFVILHYFRRTHFYRFLHSFLIVKDKQSFVS